MNKRLIFLALSCIVLIGTVSSVRLLEAESTENMIGSESKWGGNSGSHGERKTVMGGNNGKWNGNNNVGSGPHIKAEDCESKSSNNVGNTGHNGGWNHKNNVGTGSGNDGKKSHYGGNSVNTGNYYTNKWGKKEGNTVIVGNPTNTSNGVNTKITGPWPKSGKK